jgi:hypothetical protein
LFGSAIQVVFEASRNGFVQGQWARNGFDLHLCQFLLPDLYGWLGQSLFGWELHATHQQAWQHPKQPKFSIHAQFLFVAVSYHCEFDISIKNSINWQLIAN